MNKGDFIGMLFHVRDYLDVSAFQCAGVGSKNTKDALLKLSKELLISIHSLISGVQGEEGFLDIIIPQTKYEKTPVEFLQTFKKYLEGEKLFNSKWQKALITSLTEKVASTIYEIKYLK